ncbi:hypothetical protein JQC65_26260, partial [Escherichia coli]|uniref:hypothetical protein n=1 Tax=Escherichia coli TaxID=562 RepID=UPI001CBAF0E4
TKAALRQANGDPARFAELRRQRYRQIAQDDPSQRRFLRGWLARVDRYAGTDPSEAALSGPELPAYERRPVGPIQPARPEPLPPEANPDQIETRIHNVLSERFGSDWPDRIDEV